jgi:hypothetical protein
VKKKTLIFLAAVMVTALLLAGCGGDGTTALTKAEFVKQGEGICKRINNERSAAIEAFAAKSKAGPGKPLSLGEQLKLVLKVALPPVKAEAQQLDELGAPEGEEAKTQAFIDAMETAIEEVEQNPGSVLKPETSPFTAVGKMAKQYGFETCAQF